MATQNFRVKNGLEVGSATTITSTDAFIGGNLTVAGVTTFQGQVNIEGPITTDGGASIGEDVVTRNLYSSGVSTFIGAISGSSASFSGDVTVGGVLKYEDVVNVDSIGIATARSGLRITDGGLDVVGVSTFSNSIDANGDLDVDGHTELDNLNVSGVSTFVGVSTFQDKVVFDSTNSIQIPVGDTSQRDPSPVAGQIRYNSQLSSFEGYGPGNAWGSLGGVKDVNQDTYIIPEVSAGSNEDILYFYNAGSNTATISSTTATVNVDFAVTGVSTFTGSIDVNGYAELDDVNVSGVSTFVGIVTTQDSFFVGNDFSVAGDARVVGVLTVGSSSLTFNGDTNTINVGHGVTIHTTTASVNQLEVVGLSTFVGIITSRHNLFVGNNLSVAGDAKVVGVLTVGSGTITIDGETNTINVGSGATIHTTTVSVNQLEVAGLSTFTGISTFIDDLHVGGTLYTPSLIVGESTVLGEDFSTRNLSISGIATVTGSIDANGDLDVDGHTELDNVNVSGVLTATSANFSGNVTVLGDLTYENVTNVDSVGIATARSGLRVTGGGLDVVGVSTFNDGVNVASGNTYQINGVDVLSATVLGTGITASSLRSVSPQLISDRVELTTGQPDSGDYVLIYDTTDSQLKKATIQNAALQGVQGIQGTQGIQGVQGTQGIQGVQGTQGVQGVQGTQGIQGVQGTQGIQGVQGVQGTYGTQGTQGIYGPVAGSANQVVYKDGSNNPTGSPNLTFDGGTLDASNVNVSGILTATTIVGDGSNITGISTNYYKGEMVGFDNVLDTDITITSAYKTAIIYVDQDLTVDIEEGATITIDDGCYLNIIS